MHAQRVARSERASPHGVVQASLLLTHTHDHTQCARSSLMKAHGASLCAQCIATSPASCVGSAGEMLRRDRLCPPAASVRYAAFTTSQRIPGAPKRCPAWHGLRGIKTSFRTSSRSADRALSVLEYGSSCCGPRTESMFGSQSPMPRCPDSAQCALEGKWAPCAVARAVPNRICALLFLDRRAEDGNGRNGGRLVGTLGVLHTIEDACA